jgi:anti-anti-sigma factor
MSAAEGFGRDDELGRVVVCLGLDTSVISLIGEIDLAAQQDLDAACGQVLGRGLPVRIDLSGLTFIDSSGLGFFTRIIQAAAGGSRPEVTGVSPLILDTFRTVGLAQLVEFTETGTCLES